MKRHLILSFEYFLNSLGAFLTRASDIPNIKTPKDRIADRHLLLWSFIVGHVNNTKVPTLIYPLRSFGIGKAPKNLINKQ